MPTSHVKKISTANEPSTVDIPMVINNSFVYAKILGQNKTAKFVIDIDEYQNQEVIIGKKVGDKFKLPGISLTYQIERILSNRKNVIK